MTASPEEKIDGRELRALRNREAIIEAMVTLALAGKHPPIDTIAQAAGLSVRSVYRHFDSLDDVREIAANRILCIVAEHIGNASGPLDPDRPLVDRGHSLVAARFSLHDEIGVLVRNVGRRGRDRTRAMREHDIAVQIVSDQVAALFAPEFDEMAAADRTIAHAMVDALTSFETVDQLLSVDDADRSELADRLCRQILTVFDRTMSDST